MIEELVRSGIPEGLIVIIVSALPIVELRGALPLAINFFQIPWYWALCLAIIGNLFPVPFLLLLSESIAKMVSRVGSGKKLVDWVFHRTRQRGRIIERYEKIGLVLFVAIPLPFTGAWTGSLAAFLFGLKFHHAFLTILCGIIIAGAIVTCLSLLGWAGAVIAGIGLSGLVTIGLWKT
ncbi:MAG: small multi-drug export [Dehalococcoidales bacterium]|nr:small multi-drug export [Dehalococcoidales bacterium]MDP6576806.1 small multi-drug export protein [Dehalococcoidales bacterium]MDP6824595.1 small multi-drug export protein [Dehalococcoidales bacterium]